MRSIVFTLIGPDEPGLVQRVAACVANRGGNWERGSFQTMEGQFVGLLSVGVDDSRLAELQLALQDLPGLRTVVAEARETDRPDSRSITLSMVGADRVGIIHRLSSTLAKLGINVREMESWTERAPMSGEPSFHATAKLDVPSALASTELKQALEALGHELMVELTTS